jgi:hypothetical protein
VACRRCFRGLGQGEAREARCPDRGPIGRL